jgi:hypothetical protein
MQPYIGINPFGGIREQCKIIAVDVGGAGVMREKYYEYQHTKRYAYFIFHVSAPPVVKQK